MDQTTNTIQDIIDHPELLLSEEERTSYSIIGIVDKLKASIDSADYSLTYEQKLQQFENLLAKQDISKDVSQESFNRQIQKANPDYKPPRNVSDRRDVMSNARKNYVRGLLITEKTPLYTEPLRLGTVRSIYSIMRRDDTEEARTENDRIVHILNDGTTEEKHDLFLDVIDRLAQVDVEKIANMQDSEMVNCFAENMDLFQLAAEQEHLIGDFRALGFNLTPKEEQAFRNIATPVFDLHGRFKEELIRITNPYYPEVDSMQIPLGFELKSDNGDGYAAGCADVGFSISMYVTRATNSFLSLSGSSGKRDVDFYFSDSPDFHKSKTDDYWNYYDKDLAKDLRMGKPVYAILNTDLKSGNLSNIHAMQDFHGKANLTLLPKVQPKPNGLQRFFHNVIKYFGGKGLDVCNNYDQYVTDTAAIQEEHKKLPPPPFFPEREKQVKAVNQLVCPGLEEQDLELYTNAVNRTKSIISKQDTIDPNEKELNRQHIEARQELTKMVRGKTLDPEAAKKCMATILAATMSIQSSLNVSYLDKFKETIQNSEVFKKATADLSKKTLVDFLGGNRQANMVSDLGSGIVKSLKAPNVSPVRQASAQQEIVQESPKR